jgi:hypothetical protein
MKRLYIAIAVGVLIISSSNAQYSNKKPPPPVTIDKYAPYTIRIAKINGPWNHTVYVDESIPMPPYYIPVHFLERAKRNGYNYICAEFVFQNSPDSLRDWNADGTLNGAVLKNKLKNVFKQVDEYGMQLIPYYSLGSCHARDYWKMADSTIHHNVYVCNDTIHQCPVFAPHEPLDDVFEILIDVIALAFSEAVPGKNLDFIHIGHDEPVAFASYPTLLIGQDTLDRNYIYTYGHNIQDGIEKLLANEIRRRVETVRSVCAERPYGFTTRTIIFADAWDPEHIGGDLWPVRWNYQLIDYVKTCGAINENDASAVKDDLVFMPWMYTTTHAGEDYDTYNTLSTYNDKDFDFIFAHAIVDRYIVTPEGKIYPTEFFTSHIKQLGEWINTHQLPEFREHAIGCAAVPWCWYKDPETHLAFFSLDYIAQQTWYYPSIMD